MHAHHGWWRRFGAALGTVLAALLPAALASAQYAYPTHAAQPAAPFYTASRADYSQYAEPPVVLASCTTPMNDCAAPVCHGQCGGGCADCACACCPDMSGWYISISGGLQHRETVREIGDPTTFLEFGPGFSANAALGYRFDMFRLEAEYSFMNNEIDFAGSGGLSSNATGNINIRALMFNVYHDIEIGDWSWKPYVGAGVGIYQSEINSLYPDFFTTLGAPFENVPVGTTSDMPFAYQFRVGASRMIGERTEFYAGYRYFHGTELTFASQPFSNFAPTFSPNGAVTHNIEFGLRIKF